MKFQKNVIMESLYDELKNIISSLVVKVPSYAKKGETVDSVRNGQEYLDAVDECDNFRTYATYEEEVLIAAGVPSVIIPECIINRDKIPEAYRDAVVKAKRAYVIEHYDELNPYYRKYNGLPESDADFVYLTRSQYTNYNIPYKIPIHKIDPAVIKLLRLEGVLKELKDKYPELEYLNFLGDSRVSIYTLRKAKQFQIIQSYTSYSDSINNDFNDFYLKAREYVLHEIYDNAFFINSEYYDAFIGMAILFMAIQLTVAHFIKTGIKLDFYDSKTLNFIFNGYGIYFYEDIPAIYLRRMLKNLNSLLRYKGTNKVVVDICSLFGFDNIEIMSYYLLKDRRYDSNGMPVFEYHQVINEDGEMEEKENYDRMYDLKFVQVPDNTKNMLEELENKGNHYDYDIFVSDDPYWNPDEDAADFKQKIFEMEFNYIQTKYFSLKTIYDIIKMSFEVQYFFRMIADLKPHMEFIQIPLGKVDVTTKFKLFDVVVLLFALVCKKYKYSGTIITDPVSIANVLGFNFQNNLDYIVNVTNSIVDGNGKPKDMNKYVVGFAPTTLEEAKDLVYNFFANKDIHDTLVQKRYDSETIEDYNAYEKLYRATMITEDNKTMYTKPDGVIASSYIEYLRETEPAMWKYVEKTDGDGQINDAIEYILTTLNDLFVNSGFDYLFQNLPGIGQDMLKRYIFDVIRIFKSFTVDLKSFNVYYVFDDKYMQNFKLLEKVLMKKSWLDNDRIPNIIDNLLNDSSINVEDRKIMVEDIISLMKRYLIMVSKDFTNMWDGMKFEKFSEYLSELCPISLLEKITAWSEIHDRHEIDSYIYSLIAILKAIEKMDISYDIKFEAQTEMATALSALLDILFVSSDVSWEDNNLQFHLETLMKAILNMTVKLGLDEVITFVKTRKGESDISLSYLLSFSIDKRIDYRWLELFIHAIFSAEKLMQETIVIATTKTFETLYKMGALTIFLDQLKTSEDWKIDSFELITVLEDFASFEHHYAGEDDIKVFDDAVKNKLIMLTEDDWQRLISELLELNGNETIRENLKAGDFNIFSPAWELFADIRLSDASVLTDISLHMYSVVHIIEYIIQNKPLDFDEFLAYEDDVSGTIRSRVIERFKSFDERKIIQYQTVLEKLDLDAVMRMAFNIVTSMTHKVDIIPEAIMSRLLNMSGQYDIEDKAIRNDVYNTFNQILSVGEAVRAVSTMANIDDVSIKIFETLVIDRQ